jgi:adenylate cyclase
MLRQMELPILDSIIGTQTVQRGLTIRLRRSEGETIEGALMLCALAGWADIGGDGAGDEPFTALAAYVHGARSMISGGGGLVLKASDDVILAVFPHDDPREACKAALNTARVSLKGCRLAGCRPPRTCITARFAMPTWVQIELST